MRFWDASAIVPLCVTEPATARARGLLDGDPAMIVWWGSRVEVSSAIERNRREGRFDAADARAAHDVLLALAGVWSEVSPAERVRTAAERLLRVHALRAADALQLAAALSWCRDRPAGHAMVAYDERLRSAAVREGFDVLPE